MKKLLIAILFVLVTVSGFCAGTTRVDTGDAITSMAGDLNQDFAGKIATFTSVVATDLTCDKIYYFSHQTTTASSSSPAPLFTLAAPALAGYSVKVTGFIGMAPYTDHLFTGKAFEINYMISGYTGGTTRSIQEVLDGTAFSQSSGDLSVGDLDWALSGTTLTVDGNFTGATSGAYNVNITYEVEVRCIKNHEGTQADVPVITFF